jgi:predicted phosphoribosyltransferase
MASHFHVMQYKACICAIKIFKEKGTTRVFFLIPHSAPTTYRKMKGEGDAMG